MIPSEELDEFRGKGVVFLAWDWDRGSYSGYWDLEPDGPPRMLEQAPRTSSLDEVVKWGRERAPTILIRPESDPTKYYWAGVGPVPEHLLAEGFEDLGKGPE